MTRQPAIQVRPQFSVAGDTETHLKSNLLQAVIGFYVPVAFATVKPGPLDVGDMVEIDEVGNPEDAHPGDRLLLVEMLLFFQELGVLGDDIFMAEKTFLHRGDPRIGRPLHKGMAEPAVDLLYPRMDAMAEVNRLLRPKVEGGNRIIKVDPTDQQSGRDAQPNKFPPRFYIFVFQLSFTHF